MGLMLNLSKELVDSKGSKEVVPTKANRLYGMTITERKASPTMSLVGPIPLVPDNL